MRHRVSVVTPSYNQGRFIGRTIESVLSQSFQGDLEYLVMDGDSQDETVDVLRRYTPPVQWVSEKDRGQADAINKGWERATGEIIGWLNSDDIYYPGAIAAACEALDAHPEADVVYGDANHIDENDGMLERYPTEPWDFNRLLDTCYLCQPAVFFRKSVVDRFGALNPDLQFCLDYEYWIRLAISGAKFLRIEQTLAGSRLYAETKTLGSRLKVHSEINDMLRRQVRRVPDRWLFNYAHVVLEEKGVPRSATIKFPILASGLSLYASLRWNHSISGEMQKVAAAWTAAALRNWRLRGAKR